VPGPAGGKGGGPFTLAEAEAVAAGDVIAALDTSAFSEADAVNLILQRSDIIGDREGANGHIKAWEEGDDGPLRADVAAIGTDRLVRRAAAFIFLEYLALRPVLAEAPPVRATDIGCGYAFFDLFLARDFGTDLTLVDIETSAARHFGFRSEGAAYTSLAVAARNLEANGVAAGRITTLNPGARGISGVTGQDLVVSFLSCGFHYPWTTYEGFFREGLVPRGRVILDLRRRTADRVSGELAALGAVRRLETRGPAKAVKLCVTRAG